MNEPPSRPGKRIGLLMAASGLFSCCGGIARFGDRPKNGIRVGHSEADLNEHLPDGSTWEQAEAWFASHGIEPGGIYTLGDNRKVGLHAIVPNDGLLDSAEIRIEVHFSPEGRLTKRSIYRFVYSL
jgi:hypothetical protein